MENYSDEEEKVVHISKEDLNNNEEDSKENFSDPQNLVDNPSVIQNNSEEELFQSQSKDNMNKDKNESSIFLKNIFYCLSYE